MLGLVAAPPENAIPAVRSDKARENVGYAALLLVRLATDAPSSEVMAREIGTAIEFLRRAQRTIRSRGTR